MRDVRDEIPKVEKIEPRSAAGPLQVLLWAAVAGGVLILLADTYLPALVDRLARDWPEDRSGVRIVLLFVAAAVCLPDLGIAVYVWRLGDRAIRESRFPPEGTRVLGETPTVYGREASQRGRVLKAAGIVLAVAGIGIFVVLVRFAALFDV